MTLPILVAVGAGYESCGCLSWSQTCQGYQFLTRHVHGLGTRSFYRGSAGAALEYCGMRSGCGDLVGVCEARRPSIVYHRNQVSNKIVWSLNLDMP